MHLSWLLFVFSTLLRYTSALEPWYFTWTDPSGKKHSESSSTPDVCQKIDNPVGNHFDWTSSNGWCIYLWENNNCTGTTAGHTCESWPWRRDSGKHLLSFKAVGNSSDLPDNSDAPPPTTNQTNTGTANTANDSDANTDNAADSKNSHSLSGGAIAGIVIGVVVGVAILATIAWFFLFYLRRQKKASAPGLSTEHGPSETGYAPVEPSVVPHNPPFTTLSEMPNDQKEKPGELTDNHIVEMDNSQRTAELDATETVMRQNER